MDLEQVRLQQERSAKQGLKEAAFLQPEGRVPISQVHLPGHLAGHDLQQACRL